MLKLNSFSDQKIIERIQRNDRRVLAEVFLKYERMVNSFLLKQGGAKEDAQDLLQEAVIVLWQKVNSGQFVLTSKLSTFILAVVKNKWLAIRRKPQFISKEDKIPDMRDEEPNSLKVLIENEKMEKLQQALRKISAICRKLLTLFYYEEQDMDSIAGILDLANADVAKSKKYQCKKKLQEVLTGQPPKQGGMKMKCNDILRNDIHEKYLLNRLSPLEMQEYEKHLGECADCRAGLDKERLLVGGIRQLGREEMKAELREQIEELRSRKRVTDWTLLYKIAAVLFVGVFLPGLSYYYFNMEPLRTSSPLESSILVENIQDSADIMRAKEEEKGTHAVQDKQQNALDKEIQETETPALSKTKKNEAKRVLELRSDAAQMKKGAAKPATEIETRVRLQTQRVSEEVTDEATIPDLSESVKILSAASGTETSIPVSSGEKSMDTVIYHYITESHLEEELMFSKKLARADASEETWLYRSGKGIITVHARNVKADRSTQKNHEINYKVVTKAGYNMELLIRFMYLEKPNRGANYTYILKDLYNLEIIKDDSLKYHLNLLETQNLVQPNTN